MKKELTVLFAAALGTICFCNLTTDTVSAETDGDFEYVITDKDQKTCKITAYEGGSKSVTVPGMINGYKVTEIGVRAFYEKTVSDVTLPDSVEKIGRNAFTDCHDLTSIKLPSDLRKIGNYAFYGCEFKEISIPQYVDSIGVDAIPSSVESIVVDENNKHFDSRENCNAIIETSTNTLVLASNKTAIPDTVTAIGDGAFGDTNFKEITIPSSVKKIGGSAFAGCSELETINMSEGLTYIGINAFFGCHSLTEIKLPDSVETLKDRCFIKCAKLESINIPANLKKTNLTGLFSMCPNIKHITVSESNAFYYGVEGCNAVIERKTDKLVLACNNTTIPSSVKEIGDYAFWLADNISSIKIPDGVKVIGERAFSGLGWTNEITIPDSVEEIGDYAFDYCANLKKIKLPSSLKVIGEGAFSGCPIKKITIPKGVTTIKDKAFKGCGLEKVKLPDSLKTIGGSAFADCKLTEIRIPKNLKNVEWAGVSYGAFAYGAFENCPLKKISVDPENPYYDSREGCNAVIEKKTGKLVLACNKTTIPSSVKEIGDFAFYTADGISNIKIPGGVKVIGTKAFSYCYKLKKITIPKSIKRMGRNPFASEDLKTVCYKGSKADWKKIEFEEPEDSKIKIVRFNSKG